MNRSREEMLQRKAIFDALISVGPVRPSPGSYVWRRSQAQADAAIAALRTLARENDGG